MHKFCQAYVSTDYKSDNVTNNISETFNSYIIQARSKPIVDMLEEIRSMLMQRMFVKKDIMLTCTDEICPNIRKKLEKFKEDNRYCMVTPSENMKFEIQCLDKVHVVNQSCSCWSWDLCRIPCEHVISCIAWMKDDLDKYVSDFYKRKTYLKIYVHFMEPLREKEAWPNVEGPPVLPPIVKKMSGRPKKLRRRELNEEIIQRTNYSRQDFKITCTLCFSNVIIEGGAHLGHNQ
ncbi:hypothetical protein Cni_G27995 [Canna indica]|uniref:SWIM-type domain-containing protein n=1 Tax=Canna indica TaxID=4628 RepID=A0AAQ3QRW3_9LILI|nr:hypothetical protein Cni_G27995 [Canna indica]